MKSLIINSVIKRFEHRDLRISDFEITRLDERYQTR